MTTIISNPGTPAPTPVTPVVVAENSGTGFLIGTMLVIAFAGSLLYFGIPAIKNMGPVQLNIPAPQVNIPAPKVVVPDKLDVVVTQSK